MSEFYNTFTALVAHLENTLPAEPSAEQQKLLNTATIFLNMLQFSCASANLYIELFDDVEAIFNSRESIDALFNLDERGTAMAVHSIQTAVEFASHAASLLNSKLTDHH